MPTLAESLFDGLRDKATAVTKQAGEAAGKAVEVAGGAADAVIDKASDTVESAKQDLQDEPTPAESRAKLDDMADATRQRPFADEPGSRALFDKSIGYAVFDTRQVSYLIAAGYSRGVAMDRATGSTT